jgi:hypothetical protein
VSTGLSWTDLAGRAACWRRRWDRAVRATADVGPLIAFRASNVRGRRRVLAGAALGLILVLTVVFAWAPAYLPGAAGSPPGQTQFESAQVILLLPTMYMGILVISIVSAAAAGGGRELLPRDQAVAFPVSPTTDHLGALVMAPLNIAWMLQSWAVLAATAFVVGPHNLLAAQVPVLVWLLVATTVAQLVAWVVELVRRGRHGAWVMRGVVVVLVAVMATLIVSGELVRVLDKSPTLQVLLAAIYASEGQWLPWLARVGLLAFLAVLAAVTGAFVAHDLSRTPARDEMRAETTTHAQRPNPLSDLAAILRADRAGVWRSVPLRRGFAVLALLPGLVAVASALEWYMLNILPGLVASGGALLFGVNAWCLDGRGTLWRDSLPVQPRLAFVARVIVLGEVLLAATAVALLLAALRAGAPSAAQVVAVLCSAVVVTLQVVTGSMRWSVRQPFAVDMRSARATPAPPLTMVGYSTRLALVTTCTGMLFVVASRAPSWQGAVVLAVPFLLVSLLRLAQTARAWDRPEVRSRVVTTVAS